MMTLKKLRAVTTLNQLGPYLENWAEIIEKDGFMFGCKKLHTSIIAHKVYYKIITYLK